MTTVLRTDSATRTPHTPWRSVLAVFVLTCLLHVVAVAWFGTQMQTVGWKSLPQPIYAKMLLPQAETQRGDLTQIQAAEAFRQRNQDLMTSMRAGHASKAKPKPKPAVSEPEVRPAAGVSSAIGTEATPENKTESTGMPAASMPAESPAVVASAPADVSASQPLAAVPQAMAATSAPALSAESTAPVASASVAANTSHAASGLRGTLSGISAPVPASSAIAVHSQPMFNFDHGESIGKSAAAATGANANTGERSALFDQDFVWPKSTHIEFSLGGYYRGPLHGSGKLDWTRKGDEYESHLQASLIRNFEFRSKGRISRFWLLPERYMEIGSRGEVAINFQHEQNRISFSAITDVVEMPPGVQDTGSLFVQLSAMLNTQPSLFKPGATLRFPIARPRGLATWEFQVIGEETIQTALGTLKTFHLYRAPAKPTGDIGVNIWFSPQMQNLPVRIAFNMGADITLDLAITAAYQEQ